jgi:hypothetical protein
MDQLSSYDEVEIMGKVKNEINNIWKRDTLSRKWLPEARYGQYPQ